MFRHPPDMDVPVVRIFFLALGFLRVSSSLRDNQGRLDLTVSPVEITIGGHVGIQTATATCSLAGGDITSISNIELGKAGNESTTKVSILTNNDNSPILLDLSIADRATVSGSIKSKRGDLVLHITNPVCEDGGEYYCFASYATSKSMKGEVRKRINVKANPESLTIERMPNISRYAVKTQVFLRCSGNIGNMFDPNSPEATFKWDWKRSGENDWIPYTEDIAYSIPVATTNKCQYHSVSILTRRVTQEDDQREFRCSVYDGAIAAHSIIRTDAKDLETSDAETVHLREKVPRFGELLLLASCLWQVTIN